MTNKRAQFFPMGDINPRAGFPLVTLVLIVINIIVFIMEFSSGFIEMITEYGFIPASPSFLDAFTSMFLHGDLGHILGNMWYLWIFGDNMETRLGKIKYTLLYFLSGFAATFLHYLTNIGSPIPAVGASGAISGILGAYLVTFPNIKIRVWSAYGIGTVPSYVMIGLWFILQLVLGTFTLLGSGEGGIAFFAHVGGFIAGVALGKILAPKKI